MILKFLNQEQKYFKSTKKSLQITIMRWTHVQLVLILLKQ